MPGLSRLQTLHISTVGILLCRFALAVLLGLGVLALSLLCIGSSFIMDNNSIRLPKSSQHIAIVGRNGSGKTQAALWHLSKMPFDRRPYIAIDFKGDEHINAIERARHIGLGDEIPKAPGIYIVHPTPDDVKTGMVDAWLWRIYQRENTGLWFDEGYMLRDSTAFETLLTQGRSKRIPIITLTQRPVWVSRFVFSESMFYQVFALTDRRDKKTVESFAPINMDAKLPEFHSWYYDVGKDRLTGLKPVPSEQEILADIDSRLKTIRRRTAL